MEKFIGQYAVTKTLRAKLWPVGKTKETFKAAQILARDEKRAEDYVTVKKLIDDYHKQFIEETLETAALDWSELAEAYAEYGKDKDRKKLEKVRGKYRAELAKLFEKDKDFKKLFKKELFTELLKPTVDSDKKAVETFKEFSTAFTGFHENRKNVYSKEEISTAVPYRAAHDNFPRFLMNLEMYEKLKAECSVVVNEAEKELAGVLRDFGEPGLDGVFAVSFYNKLLTQKGINFYNALIGGIAGEAGTQKIRGINECANQYGQQHPEFAKTKRVKMCPLYKQILSDRESLSFVPKEFSHDVTEGDKQVWDGIAQFYGALSGECAEAQNGEAVNHFAKLKALVSSDAKYEFSEIYIRTKDFADVSKRIFKRWSALKDALKLSLEQKRAPTSKEKKALKADDFDETKIAEEFSVKDLNALLPFIPKWEDEEEVVAIQRELFDEIIKSIRSVEEAHSALYKLKNVAYNAALRLQDQKQVVERIKSLLDSVLDLFRLLTVFKADDILSRDDAFYHDFDSAYEFMRGIVSLYNKVRNYLTRKPSSEGKIKLTFECPTLADGWDLNKESANSCVILRKDGLYYLGVMAKGHNKIFKELRQDTGDCFEKIEYKQIALPFGVGGFVRKCFSTAKKYGWLCPDDCLNDEGKIISNDNEAEHNLVKIIDVYKDFFDKYEKDGFKYKDYNFEFKPSAEYKKLSEFFSDVERQRYKIGFKNISKEYIDSFVNEGKLYLFQIYNKDFAKGSTGAPNLHTLYFKHIFSPENLGGVVIKLSGGAELFYRKVSVKELVRHAKGEKMVNRWYIDENGKSRSLSDKERKELFEYVNGRQQENELSEEAKKLKERLYGVSPGERAPNGKIAVKTVQENHELVKDKRFTKDAFFFHFPIVMNFKAPDSPVQFDHEVRKHLLDLVKEKAVKIIGIDRGERNLLYVSLIDLQGTIIMQKSLNIVESNAGGEKRCVDYHDKLDVREKERDEAQKNWQSIGKIKELKEGYLSQAVYEIASLAVEHNAIIALEDLNFGFKRGRFKVEKQVYQKFEGMLIKKLNYLAFKDKDPKEPGGVLNAYQLTAPFTSFKELGKQSGWLFYVPAAYTSSIDPVTGFANRFSLGGITNVEKKKDFFRKFDDIRYDRETNSFAFSFQYGKFNVGDRIKDWKVYTKGGRLVYRQKEQKTEIVFPTEDLKKCFDEQGINWKSGESLKDAIAEVSAEKSNAPFFDRLYRSFKNTLQLRNTCTKTGEDYIISPVKNAAGGFFDSRIYEKMDKPPLPKDADANGAYHIALNALYLLHCELPEEKGYLKSVSRDEWFRFAEEKPYRN